MRYLAEKLKIVRYRGFVILEQHNKTWLIRPERSPLELLPFRTSSCSLSEAKKLLDKKLTKDDIKLKAA